MASFKEYTEYDATGLAELIRRGEVSPEEALEAAIAQVERVNPSINAVIHRLYEEGRRTVKALPEGPFRGVPFLVKDLVSAYGGAPQEMGSRFMRGYVAPQDSELMRRYKQTGAVVFGKTNTPELGIVGVTEPLSAGATVNPWDVTRTPGGSSGGSGAAVASRMAPMAGGGDGGGSIRIPASCCGLFGLKPSRGRTPTGPDQGELWQGCAVEHVLTRSVRDSAAMLDAIAGGDPGAPYVAPSPARPWLEEVGAEPGKLRIAFTTRPFVKASVDRECVRAVEEAAKLLEELGHHVVEASPEVDGSSLAMNFLVMLSGEVAADVAELEALRGRKARFEDLEVETHLLAALGERFTAGRFSQATRELDRMGRQVGRFMERWDVLLTPTLARPPVQLGELKARGAEAKGMEALARLRSGRVIDWLGLLEPSAEKMFSFTPFTFLFNVSGNPAMNVPLHWTAGGLPIGVHFVGRYGDEATLFRLASQLERAQPWEGRRPGVASRL